MKIYKLFSNLLLNVKDTSWNLNKFSKLLLLSATAAASFIYVNEF